MILDINFKGFNPDSEFCDHTFINNKLYIINKHKSDIYINIIEDYILKHKYIHRGISALIKENILYVLDDDLDIHKYNITDLKYIETIEICNNININVNLDFVDFNNINFKNIRKYKCILTYCDKPYIVMFVENVKNIMCRIFDVNNKKNYYIIVGEGKYIKNKYYYDYDIVENIYFTISYNNENIYISHNNKTVTFNTKTNSIINETIKFKISKGIYRDSGDIIPMNNTKFLIHYENDKCSNVKIYNIDSKEIIEYKNNCEYYLNNNIIKGNICLVNGQLCIVTNPTLSIFNNDDKMVKLGESFIPLSILIERCGLIKSMFYDLKDNFNLNEIQNELFKNIDCYVEYIKTNNIENAMELYKIMNYLEDIDLEHIVCHITKNIYLNYEDNTIYDILEMLYKSPFTIQFIYLLNQILDIKDYEEIIENLEDKQCYNYILKYNLIRNSIRFKYIYCDNTKSKLVDQ